MKEVAKRTMGKGETDDGDNGKQEFGTGQGERGSGTGGEFRTSPGNPVRTGGGRVGNEPPHRLCNRVGGKGGGGTPGQEAMGTCLPDQN